MPFLVISRSNLLYDEDIIDSGSKVADSSLKHRRRPPPRTEVRRSQPQERVQEDILTRVRVCGLAARSFLPQSAAEDFWREISQFGSPAPSFSQINHHGTPRQCLGVAADRILDGNDPEYSELPKRWHGTVSGWSSTEIRGIVQAAGRNTSFEEIAIAPTEMTNDEADTVASIEQSLPCIEEFHIEATEDIGGDLPVSETVDRLLYGIVHNQTCKLTCFSTVYSLRFEAMVDLAARFPTIEVLQLGCSDVPCHVSDPFALAFVQAFACLPNLKTLYYTHGVPRRTLRGS